ncbi:anthranilate synthase component I family protein [Caldithrix abyssi]
MIGWVEQYLEKLTFRAEKEGAFASGGAPCFYLPGWQLPDGQKVEIYIEQFFAVFSPAGREQILVKRAEKSEEIDGDLFRLLNAIEACRVQAEHFFYLLLLSYDFGAARHGIQHEIDFYSLPEWYLILPARGYLRYKDANQVLRFDTENAGLACRPPLKTLAQGNGPAQSESQTGYLKKIQCIRDLIASGEFYQLNFTLRFSKPAVGQGFEIFKRWYKKTRAPRSFYLAFTEAEILSISPERFWLQKGQTVLTEPIKGTIKRSADVEEDLRLKQLLLNSKKDRAELDMITDLLRNDFSKVCSPGSVLVKKRHDLRTYSHVHHLVSEVRGRLLPGKDFMDLIDATFPGGSITGCPKIAAMQYINRFEVHNRSFYTGSFFLRFPLRNVTDSSILIRTAILKDGYVHYQAGGGIVIDSEPQKEYEECLAKAAPFLKD